jgi:hypothetical protein
MAKAVAERGCVPKRTLSFGWQQLAPDIERLADERALDEHEDIKEVIEQRRGPEPRFRERI